jgi:Protein kinase domain
LALYKNSVDAVLQVARQLASALGAAHQAGIIHRDVKPKNILFTGNGHDAWLSDFGICLIRKAPRITETPEVMGPRAFMAPELEDGGQLDVTPAADIYSLGKVIYFMLSGGVIVPRERLHEPQFAGIFDKGQRHQLLEMLLRRMICPLEQRISTAADVLAELKKIEDWTKNAQLLPISESALAAIQGLQRRSIETGRITEENREARRQEAETQSGVQLSLTAWLTAELQKVAATVSSDSIVCTVRDAGVPNNFGVQTGHASMYRALNGVELVVDDVNDPQNRAHLLQFFLCKHTRVLVSVRSGHDPAMPVPEPARDTELAIAPLYRQMLKHTNPGIAPSLGYISRQGRIGQTRGRLQMPSAGLRDRRPNLEHYRVAWVMPTFEPDVSVHEAFRASEWPVNEASLRAMLEEAFGIFFEHIGR